jgi:hypothetical protein
MRIPTPTEVGHSPELERPTYGGAESGAPTRAARVGCWATAHIGRHRQEVGDLFTGDYAEKFDISS